MQCIHHLFTFLPTCLPSSSYLPTNLLITYLHFYLPLKLGNNQAPLIFYPSQTTREEMKSFLKTRLLYSFVIKDFILTIEYLVFRIGGIKNIFLLFGNLNCQEGVHQTISIIMFFLSPPIFFLHCLYFPHRGSAHIKKLIDG